MHWPPPPPSCPATPAIPDLADVDPQPPADDHAISDPSEDDASVLAAGDPTSAFLVGLSELAKICDGYRDSVLAVTWAP